MHGARSLKLLVIAFCLLTAAWAAAADSTATPVPSGRPKKSTTEAVLMSMAVPGLGQWYTHSYIKAAAAVIVEGSFGWIISYNNDRMHVWRRAAIEWQRSHSDTLHLQGNPYVGNQRFFQNQRNRMIWWLAGTVLLSMGDAYVDAHLYGLDFSPDLSITRGRVGLSVACKF